MRRGAAHARGNRRGRRSAQMIRIAGERIHRLFALAEQETQRPGESLPRRYVTLARRIGMRYNLRVPREYRELFCHRCSAYWVEGRTVRTRLRGGMRIRTCLSCGAIRRVRVQPRPSETPAAPSAAEQEPQVAEEELDEGIEETLEEGEGE
jgi:ribonuclease P protein subunit RPR2